MEKAYDLKFFGEQLKAQGLEVTEELAKSVAVAALDFLSKSAEISATPFDNILIPVYAMAKPKILEKLEGINPNG